MASGRTATVKAFAADGVKVGGGVKVIDGAAVRYQIKATLPRVCCMVFTTWKTGQSKPSSASHTLSFSADDVKENGAGQLQALLG